ncbi:MAG: helix-turn-helix transcriptional regulator [Thermoleophilaceae bacterium]|nr:helix-turn-helix transcriptional regulator [Thermoleophilaceae bacterium]
MSPQKAVIDQRLVKALAHPLRSRLLAILNERVASPNELAKELGEPLGVVAYHVRTLLQLKAIELVRTEPRRGAVEHYYRATMRPYFTGKNWTELPESLRQSISGSTLSLVWEDVQKATASGGFDSRPDRHLSRTPLVLDEQGWQELGKLLADVVERALELQAESAARLAESGEEGFSTKLEIMHFPSADGDDEEPTRRGSRRSKRTAAARR